MGSLNKTQPSPAMHLSDVHCHLQDPRLRPDLREMLDTCRAIGITRWMVNATREADWDAVTALARSEPGVYAAYGLHPWWQKERSPDWAMRLEGLLRADPAATLGETGLDRWMEAPDLEEQIKVLETHLELSRTLGRPITLHCLKAWQELAMVVKRHPASEAGFLLHSYSGPEAQISMWTRTGAYFSFSPGFLHPRKTRQRAAFRAVPLERLLLETDAPDMAPPEALNLCGGAGGGKRALNHPGNLHLCLKTMAEDREISSEDLALQVEENARRFFGWG
jgi:TatD DNase family protein